MLLLVKVAIGSMWGDSITMGVILFLAIILVIGIVTGWLLLLGWLSLQEVLVVIFSCVVMSIGAPAGGIAGGVSMQFTMALPMHTFALYRVDEFSAIDASRAGIHMSMKLLASFPLMRQLDWDLYKCITILQTCSSVVDLCWFHDTMPVGDAYHLSDNSPFTIMVFSVLKVSACPGFRYPYSGVQARYGGLSCKLKCRCTEDDDKVVWVSLRYSYVVFTA